MKHQEAHSKQHHKKQLRFHTFLFVCTFVALTCSNVTKGSDATCSSSATNPATTTATNTADHLPGNNKINNEDSNNSNNNNHATYSPRNLDHGVLEWISSQPGAYYNPKQIMDEREGLVGIFAKAPIAKGELLCRIPWEWTLRGDEEEDEQLSCSLVKSLIRHLELGEGSKYGPYIQYLKNQPDHQLVSAWSRPGQELMLKVLGQTREENSHRSDDEDDEDYRRRPPRSLARHFPPLGMTSWIDDDFRKLCNGKEQGYKAALLALMRADDSLMIPGYDFYNHRNGHWHNADTQIQWYKAHETRAIRDIQAGEQIYISYNRCTNCEGRYLGYGSADMFRDYGFIEAFPQRWHYFHNNQVEFELLHGTNHTTYIVEWIHQPKNGDAVVAIQVWLKEQVRRLERVWHLEYGHGGSNSADMTYAAMVALDRAGGISEFEWNMTWAFQRANLVALKAAIQALPSTESKVEVTILPPGNIDIPDLYYPLDPATAWKRIDAEFIRCSMTEFDVDDYVEIDVSYGFMQRIDISRAGTDTCMDRNRRVHVCSSFRPTYYEYFVHPAASLLSTVQRVLIMGNGASFLLHEVMKYNATLEYVMVLEPDPAVTRLSQQHLGADPHWQDPRLEWWFGDVGAVLTLLSEDQWNSFDLVLIDLPKTSFPTTFRNGITALDLVHHQGIVVSLTNQWQEFGDIFEYTARMTYRPTSGCTQVLTMGSPSIDFLRAPSKDHGLKGTLAYEPNVMMERERRLQLIQNWQSGIVNVHSIRRQHTIKSEHVDDPLGVLELLELGSIKTTDGDLKSFTNRVKEALKQVGDEVLSTAQLPSTNSVLLLLESGYITMRSPVNKENVLGLDIYRSSDLGTLPSIRAAIVEALGASILSVYRLVSDGYVAPAVRIPTLAAASADSKIFLSATEEVELSRIIKTISRETIFKFPGQPNSVILLVCESLGQCLARDAINNMELAKNIHILEMCAAGGTALGVEELLQCERKSRDWLRARLIDKELSTNAIVLDGNLSKASLQVLDAIVNADPAMAWATWIPHVNMMVAMPSSTGTLSKAHRSFADRFQHASTGVKSPTLVSDLAVLAEFSFVHSDVSTIEVGVVVQGVSNTVTTLLTLEYLLNKATHGDGGVLPYQVQLRLVQGGPSHKGDRVVDQQFDQDMYDSPPQPASPSGIQTSFHVQSPSNSPVSLDTVTKEIISVLESMNLEPVKSMATAARTFNNTVPLAFKDGHLILRKHGTRYNFDLFYLCDSDVESTKDGCSPHDAHELVSRFLWKKNPSDWHVGAMDFFVRGSSPNMVVSRWAQTTMFTTSEKNEMYLEEEKDDEGEDEVE